jgi:hypothetical protein
MAKRWAAAAMLATEKNFRRVMGHKDMWALKAILDHSPETPFRGTSGSRVFDDFKA